MKREVQRHSPSVVACLCGAAVLLLTGAACAPPAEEAAQQAAAPVLEEIPITTASEAARQLFDEGQYFLDVGRGVEANERFRAAIAEDPGFVRAHFAQSNSALSFQEFQECLDMASSHLDAASEGEQMLVGINRTFLTNDSEKGVQLATELVSKYPNSARAAIILAGQQGRHNHNTGARASFEKALALDPTSAGALYGIANNYLFGEPKDFARAEEWAAKAIAAYPDEAKGHELMGDIKRAQGDLEAALASYNMATETDPTMPNGHHKSGHINSFLGNIEEARAAYDAGVSTAKPENKAGLAVYKTFTRIHEGDVSAALDELETLASEIEAMGTPAVQVKGLQTFAFNSHATAAMHAGMLKRAAKAVKKANELRMAIAADVGTEDAERLQKAACHQWDGLLAAYKGDAGGAAEHAEAIAALVEGDDNPRKMEGVHYVLGMSALKAGDNAAAVEHLRQANHANNMLIRYQLAVAEEGTGNTAEAQKLFAEVGSFNFNSVGFALIGRDARDRSMG
ncbi:MAG: tetratricopeptide repeat protein [Thermoanaerobaculia bacterium]